MKKRKGISLIILVITILVVLILSVAIILVLNQSGIINKANEAKFKSDVDSFKSELEIYKANKVLEEVGVYNPKLLFGTTSSLTYNNNPIEGKTMFDAISSMKDTEYDKNNLFQIVEGELVYVGTNENEKEWSTDLGIVVKDAKLEIAGVLVKVDTDRVMVEVKLKYKMPTKVTYKYTLLKGEEVIDEVTSETQIYDKTGLEKETEYRLKIEVRDEMSNFVEDEVELTTIGMKVPKIQEIENSWTNEDIEVHISFYEREYINEISIDGGKTFEREQALEVSKKIEKNTVVIARTSDASGNESVDTIEIANIDKLAPKEYVLNILTGSSTLTVTGESEDQEETEEYGKSGIKGYQYSIDGYSYYPSENETTSKTSYTFENLEQNTEYEIKVRVYDNAGNVTEITGSGRTIELIKPTITKSTEEFTKEDVTVTITYPNVVGTTKEYSYDEITWEDTEKEVETITLGTNKRVYARIVDRANQASEVAEIEVNTIDKLEPKEFVVRASQTTNSITVTGETVDNDETEEYASSGINGYQYSIDGTTWYPSNDTTTEETSHIFENVKQGTSYTVKMKAIDKAGNEKVCETVAKTVSLTKPTITPSTTEWTKGNVTVTITYPNVVGTTKEYSYDGKTWTNTTNEIETLTIGTNKTVYARLEDSTNQTSENATLTVSNIDKLPPKAFTASLTNKTATSFTINANATDEAATTDNGSSGINRYEYYVDNVKKYSGTNKTYNMTGVDASKAHTVYVNAVDNAGNVTKSNVINVAIAQFKLTVTSANTTMGTVTGGGTYNAGSSVTIKATPKTGYSFVKWSDNNTSASRSVTVNAAATYTATFKINTYVLTVNSANTAMGTVTGGGTYNYGTKVTIKATPKTGHTFVKWNDGNTSASREVTVNAAATYTATFKINTYALTVNSANTTMGTVTGGGTYNYGTKVTIKATPKTGYKFVKWSDGNTSASRSITVNAKATYTATFKSDVEVGTIVSGNTTFDRGNASYSNPTIPKGFKPIDTSDAKWANKATDYDKGLVIADAANNQFVWVPAAKYGYDYYYMPQRTTDTIGDGIDENAQITKYGGFWFGRYEVSSNAGKAVSVQNKGPWQSILYKDAKAKAEAFSTDKAAYESSLPTGKMWDTTLKFISSDGTNVDSDSNSWGNYSKAAVIGNDGSVIKYASHASRLNTGVTMYTMKKNIYDVAGNVQEWILACSGTRHYARGGDYYNSGTTKSAAYNSHYGNDEIDSNYGYTAIGFRLALYLK